MGLMVAAGILRANSRKPPVSHGLRPSGKHPEKPLESLRVLVVEDESIIAWALQTMLEDLGHDVIDTVPSGEEAVATAALLEPELIIMDISLGTGISGIEAAARIRSRSNTSVIFVSAYNDPRTKADLEKHVPGAPLLPKPISPTALREVISRIMRRHH